MVVDLRAKLEARQKAKTDPLEGGQSEPPRTRQTRSRGRKGGLEAGGVAAHEAFDQVGKVCSLRLSSSAF